MPARKMSTRRRRRSCSLLTKRGTVLPRCRLSCRTPRRRRQESRESSLQECLDTSRMSRRMLTCSKVKGSSVRGFNTPRCASRFYEVKHCVDVHASIGLEVTKDNNMLKVVTGSSSLLQRLVVFCERGQQYFAQEQVEKCTKQVNAP